MKLSKCVSYLFWVMLSVWTMSSIMENDAASQVFNCYRDHWCDPSYFTQLRRCWFVLSQESRGVIQMCVRRSCGVSLPDYFTMSDLCNVKLNDKVQKSCFAMCAEVVKTYTNLLKQEESYAEVYRTVQKSKMCIQSIIGHCLPSS